MANHLGFLDQHLIKHLGIQLPKAGASPHEQVYLRAINTILEHYVEADNRAAMIVSTLRKLTNEIPKDMAFKVSGTKIPAHSIVVSNWSAPLERMLQSGMREGYSKEINIDTESADSVKLMIQYFYEAETNINEISAFPLLRLASLYDIGSLRDKCCKFLLVNTTVENCLQVYQIATRHKIENLGLWNAMEKRSLEIIRQSASTIFTNKNPFGDMTVDEITQITDTLDLDEKILTLVARAFLQWASEYWLAGNMLDCLVNLEHENAEKFQIFVINTVKNVTHTFLVSRNTSISTVKRMIEQKSGMTVLNQYLKNNLGKFLRNDLTIGYYNIKRESSLVVSLYIKNSEEPEQEPKSSLHKICIHGIKTHVQ